MSRIYSLSTGILIASTVLSLPLRERALADSAASPAAQPVFLEKQYADQQSPENVLRNLWKQEKDRPLSFAQQMDMGVALILENKAQQAAGLFKAVVISTGDAKQKAVALVYGAQSLALAKDWRDAGELANLAGQLAPQSKSIAALRFTFWKMAGDALEQQVATDRLQQLDVNYDGKAVFEPGTIIIISLTVIAASAMVSWIVVEKPDPDTLRRVLRQTLIMVAEIGSPLVLGAAAL